jgi:hypothetical protein
MTAALPGMTTLIGVAMRRVGCEVSEVSSLTSQCIQLSLLLCNKFFYCKEQD